VFLHLDLGIGGAEQLVVNLALASLPAELEPNSTSEETSDPSTNTNTMNTGTNPSTTSSTNTNLNARVSIVTTHCDQSHCFDAVRKSKSSDTTRKPGRLADCVHVCGAAIPVHLWGYGTVVFSTLRMLYLSYVARWKFPDADVYVLDILPTPIPFLTGWLNIHTGVKCVIYYCHFPDKLLTRDTVNGMSSTTATTQQGGGLKAVLKRGYRAVMDGLEEWSMMYADGICVNSKFTQGEVLQAFPKLATHVNVNLTNSSNDDDHESNTAAGLRVLYPAIDLSNFIPPDDDQKTTAVLHERNAPIVSLNRFERKKNIEVLLHAYAILQRQRSKSNDNDNDNTDNKEHDIAASSFASLPPLIIAGGYDPRNTENVEYLLELKHLAQTLQIITQIHFRPSISDAERAKLLQSALCCVYTPHREHFGIVPLEAMFAGSAVVAGNSGGPKETVLHNETGVLVDMDPRDQEVAGENLASALQGLLEEPERAIRLGKRGHAHVKERFGLEPFRREWNEIVRRAIPKGAERVSLAANSAPSVKQRMRTFARLLALVAVVYQYGGEGLDVIQRKATEHFKLIGTILRIVVALIAVVAIRYRS